MLLFGCNFGSFAAGNVISEMGIAYFCILWNLRISFPIKCCSAEYAQIQAWCIGRPKKKRRLAGGALYRTAAQLV